MSIRRDTTINLLGSLIPFAVSFITVPIYLELLGDIRYGVLALAWLLLGYFGLFDLGLGRATAQRVAALRDGEVCERAKVFWTALTLNVGLGVIGGLIIWPVANYYFGSVFVVDESIRPEMLAAIPWLIIAVPMATVSGVLGGALQGQMRFLEMNIISVLGTIMFQLLPLAIAMCWNPNLALLLPAAILARLFTLLMLFERCKRHIFCEHGFSFDFSQARQLLSFGGWITLSSFVGPMMTIFDRFIIGAIVNAKAVTYYTVPFSLVARSAFIPHALSSALFPRFAAVTIEENQRLSREGLHVLMVVMTPLIALGVILMDPFLTWWVSHDFSVKSSAVGRVLLLGFLFDGLSKILCARLQAHGRPDLVTKCQMIEVLPYFFLLYLGLNTFGLIGAALVFSLRLFVDFILLARLNSILRFALQTLLKPMILLSVAMLIACKYDTGQPNEIIVVGIFLITTMVWAWHSAPAYLHEALVSRVRKLLFFKN